MIRKLMASCAVVALMSGGAISYAQAQNEPTAPVIVEETPVAQDNATTMAPVEAVASDEVLTPEQPTLASAYIGRSVYSSADPESDNIGDVNDLIVGDDGAITHAVVGVGGFLGIGEKDVAVPFDKLEVVERDGDIRLIYAATREELEGAPALDRTAYDPSARFQEEQAAAIDTAPDAGAPLPAPGDMAVAPDASTPPAEPSSDMAAAPDATAPAEDLTAAPADQDVAVNAPAESAPIVSGDVGFVTAGADQVQASDLMGKTVYGPDQASIGEISDLMVEKEGDARMALIDVGGFLGVGEKTVGIPFDQLQISTLDEGSEQVNVAISKEQLEQLPAIMVDTAAVDGSMAPAVPVDGTLPADQTAAAPVDPAASVDPAAPAQPADMAQAPAIDDLTTGSIATTVDYAPATQEIAASELIGAVVYGPDDANLGEVSDLVFSKTGEIDAAVVDVGGFLGMGEKPVALDFGALNVRTDENGSTIVMINVTQDQLNQAPTYEEPAQAAVQ